MKTTNHLTPTVLCIKKNDLCGLFDVLMTNNTLITLLFFHLVLENVFRYKFAPRFKNLSNFAIPPRIQQQYSHRLPDSVAYYPTLMQFSAGGGTYAYISIYYKPYACSARCVDLKHRNCNVFFGNTVD